MLAALWHTKPREVGAEVRSCPSSAVVPGGLVIESLLSALVGALVGVAATLAGQWWLADRAAKQSFADSVFTLRREVKRAGEESALRTRPGLGITPTPPLPTQAWTMFTASGHLAKVNSQMIELLARFYTTVEKANYLDSQSIILFQLSQLTTNPVASENFSEQASSISRVAHEETALLAPMVLDALVSGTRVESPQ